MNLRSIFLGLTLALTVPGVRADFESIARDYQEAVRAASDVYLPMKTSSTRQAHEIWNLLYHLERARNFRASYATEIAKLKPEQQAPAGNYVRSLDDAVATMSAWVRASGPMTAGYSSSGPGSYGGGSGTTGRPVGIPGATFHTVNGFEKLFLREEKTVSGESVLALVDSMNSGESRSLTLDPDLQAKLLELAGTAQPADPATAANRGDAITKAIEHTLHVFRSGDEKDVSQTAALLPIEQAEFLSRAVAETDPARQALLSESIRKQKSDRLNKYVSMLRKLNGEKAAEKIDLSAVDFQTLDSAAVKLQFSDRLKELKMEKANNVMEKTGGG